MSFSSEAKKEIRRVVPSARHCREAALCALLGCAGEFRQAEDGTLRLLLWSDNGDLLGKCFTLLQKTTNIRFTWHNPEEKGEVSVAVPSEDIQQDNMAAATAKATAAATAKATAEAVQKVHALYAVPFEQRMAKECCRKAWLREMFLCLGSVTDPSREYHMEFACPCEQDADRLVKVLASLGIQARVTRRKKNHVVYIKDSAAIGDVLLMIGAHAAYLELENALILKDMRNSINRRVNFETANIVKAVGAAQRQIDDIRLLEKKGVLKNLPDTLRQIAEVRLEYPDATLKELGAHLNPPVGKSGVNHRLRRLSEIAAQSDVSGGEL